MPRCAFLSTDNLGNFVVYDELTYPAFTELGWSVDAVPWRADVDWSQFDLVVIRSPWDYQQDAERFLEALARIDAMTRLENPLAVVRWNLRKDYLRDLESRGVPIVPTLWRDAGAPLDASLLDELGAALDGRARAGRAQAVVKPLISGNADHTYIVDSAVLTARGEELAAAFSERPFLVQPFMPSVVEEGEYSLFYFAGSYSHAVLKTPKRGDFRVQEEHGGRIRAVKPEPAMRDAAEHVLEITGLAVTSHALLYARVDLVRDLRAPANARFRLMELELIEPSLYFPFDPGSPERFARAAVDLMDRA